jgi:hypothetical protein
MRNYSSKQAKKGKLAYRTPDRFIPRQISKSRKIKSGFGKNYYQQNFGAGFIPRKRQITIKWKNKAKKNK